MVPSGETVFQRVGRIESYREHAEDVPPAQVEHAERMFELIDGRLSIQRVIDLSLLGKFEGGRAVADLHRAGVIKKLDPEGVRQMRKHFRAPGSATASVRQGVAVILPLLLLCTAAVLARPDARAAAPAGGAVFSIEQTALGKAREAYATRRIRNAIEAYRLAEGRWPSQLGELEKRGLVEREALAAPAGRPYYSLNREGGFVILAPER
jgi:hypothetical protein